jgi:2-polyprenyl-6-methoxyphenol hydroxylase-like FAD-dependent oxidoreductase
MSVETDVVIVGGGPIGLAHAWGIKRINPQLKIVVLEKYEEYQRKHTLVMEHKQLQKLMKSTGTENDPALSKLLSDLKTDPHIRTNILEGIFKQLATQSGVEIVIGAVKNETIEQQIFKKYPQARLIIGADGTHSVVSHSLFPKDNQVKYEFDYVLQLRYEINGQQKSEAIDSVNFYQHMARHGLIANEYVGHFAEGKTPVTMQMMISKQVYEDLKTATSKDPIKLFSDKNSNPVKIPSEIKTFITNYITYKIEHCHSKDQVIEKESIRISVNEAPATHARRVIHTSQDKTVALVGDASLGLSYFKGLNAGLESAAQLLFTLGPAIKHGFINKKETDEAFSHYQTWFLKDFSPKKIKEVQQYSAWRIRSLMKVMKAVQRIKMASMVEIAEDQQAIINDYFKFIAPSDQFEQIKKSHWRQHPHREYEPVKFGQFGHVPIKHTLLKMGKIFVDYAKPYKSTDQFKQDMNQPLVGIVNLIVGLTKLLIGLFTLNGKQFGDGLFSTWRGILEIATTPLSLIIKPITRGIASLFHSQLKIEDNHGMKKLAQYGMQRLNQFGEDSTLQNTYQLLSICNDIHRKFDKAFNRGQATDVAIDENKWFNEIRTDTSKEKLMNFFSLFSLKTDSEPTIPPLTGQSEQSKHNKI